MPGMAQDDAVAGLAETKRDPYAVDQKHASDTDHVESTMYEADGIHDGLEYPTEEEMHTLRRVIDTIPWAAYCECTIPENSCRPVI